MFLVDKDKDFVLQEHFLRAKAKVTSKNGKGVLEYA